MSWIDKDDLVGWQAYFHARNRLITTLIHSPYPKGGRVLRESFQSDVKHLVSMQYFTEHGRIEALRDLLKGPDDLHKVLGTKLPEINALKADYPDAQLKDDVDDFPAPKIGRGPMGGTVVGHAQQEAADSVGHQDRRAAADQSARHRKVPNGRRGIWPTGTTAGTGWPTMTASWCPTPKARARPGTSGTPRS